MLGYKSTVFLLSLSFLALSFLACAEREAIIHAVYKQAKTSQWQIIL